jgi:uncharacterized protein YjbI with pentapeptide repeats
MKLKLTNINLVGQKVIGEIVSLISMNKNLVYLNLSWGALRPKELSILSKELAAKGKQLRNLDLSYNMLNFEPRNQQEFKDSTQFIKNISKVFLNSVFFNHLNFSGMNIDKSHMSRLCNNLVNVQFLMAIHLNDNGITFDEDLLEECLDIFGIRDGDLN